MRDSMEQRKKFYKGDIVRYPDERSEWGEAEVVGYDTREERLILRFTSPNMYTHSCGGAVDGYRGYWAIPGELVLVIKGGTEE